MDEVLFEVERNRSRHEIAETLRGVADKLDADEPLTLSSGDDSITLEVPSRPTFEVKAEREEEKSETELSVEFELEWDESDDADGELEIS